MNTNTQHTPGQWRVHQPTTSDGRLLILHPDGERIIAVCSEGYNSPRTGPIPDEERIANARLIAAAPALLDALKSAVSYLEANRPKGKIREIFTQLNEYENGVLKPARAAISHAEGGAP